MLQIKTTPNLYGITLCGDYQDLSALYDSISRYLAFYKDNNLEFYPYHEYEYLLALNYDIRHAYMGTRNVEIVENNADSVGVMAGSIFKIPEEAKEEFDSVRNDFGRGNLYFSVEILYPLIFHYLIAFENILEDEPLKQWFDTESEFGGPWKERYTWVDVMHDRAQMTLLCALFWDNLQDLFGKEKAKDAYDYYQSVEYGMPYELYCNALIHCQCGKFKELSREEKMDFLLASLYEIIGSEDLLEYPDELQKYLEVYKNALEGVGRNGKTIMPLKAEFFDAMARKYDPVKPMYEEDFDRFLTETYGPTEDDGWDW